MPNRYYTKSDVINALKGAGLTEGDTAYFSTSLGMLGTAEGINSSDELNALFFDCIRTVLGNKGNLIVPTYSYTFGGSSPENPYVFDPLSTPAQIGPFPNYVLGQKGVVRSEDPMMSMAGLGPGIEKLFAELPSTSYGEDSVYQRLLSMNTKCVSIGLGTNWTPFIHHADWLNQVPFRYDKLFYGGIKRKNGDIQYQYWLYSAPARIDESYANAHQLGQLAYKANIWKYHPLGRARVYVCDYLEYFNFTMHHMRSNKWLMAKGPKCDVVAKDQEKMSRALLKPKENLSQDVSTQGLFNHVKACERKIVSPEISYCIKCLQQHYPIKLRHTQSGQNFYDWVVPERIENRQEKIISSMGWLSTGSWNNGNRGNKIIALCCYIDETQDLSGVYFTLSLMEKLQHTNTPYQFHCIIASDTAGFACELAKINEESIFSCLHIVDNRKNDNQENKIVLIPDARREDNPLADQLSKSIFHTNEQQNRLFFNPLQAGHNPIAKKALKQLSFENSTLIIPQNSIGKYEEKNSSLADLFKKLIKGIKKKNY